MLQIDNVHLIHNRNRSLMQAIYGAEQFAFDNCPKLLSWHEMEFPCQRYALIF
jgi:hypothetical protein